jgi:hypothetical protein
MAVQQPFRDGSAPGGLLCSRQSVLEVENDDIGGAGRRLRETR